MSEFDEVNPNVQVAASTDAAPHEDTHAPVLSENDELLELNDDFNFDDFQVVRREFFAHLHEPSVSFNNCKFYVNSACLSKFPNSGYAQVLVNRSKKILALRPCSEGSRDSFMWCTETNKGKRKPKPITCKLFFAKIVSLMDWNPDYRYKLLGKLIHANGEYLIAFDLTATEVYQRTFPEGAKPKTSRTPVFQQAWQDQFGLPFTEHRQSMQINIFDGYAIYAIKDTTTGETPDATATPEATDPPPFLSQSTKVVTLMTKPAAIETTMSVDLKKYRIRIHKATIHLIGDPKYIQLLVNPTTMVVAVLSVEQELPGDQTHKVNMRLMHSDNSYEIYSRSFITKLCDVVGGLEENCSYRLSGEIVSSNKAAAFSLKTIKRIEPVETSHAIQDSHSEN